MKEILETIILSLVDNKEAVQINEVNSEKSVVFEVKVAFTTVLIDLASKEHKKVTVEFIG